MLVEYITTSGTLAHFFSVAVFGTPLFQCGLISGNFVSFLEVLEAVDIKPSACKGPLGVKSVCRLGPTVAQELGLVKFCTSWARVSQNLRPRRCGILKVKRGRQRAFF